MSILCSLYHRTTYKYPKPVKLGAQTIRLRPASHAKTPIPAYSLKVTPENHFINWQQDPQGNYLARVVFQDYTDVLSIETELIADLVTINPFDYFLEEEAQHFPFEYAKDLKKDLRPYLIKQRSSAQFDAFVKSLPIKDGMTMNDFMMSVNKAVYDAIDYNIRLEPGVQSPGETLKLGTGSCRDSAWLLVHIMRRLGIASRFCSGYLIQLKADLTTLDGELDGAATDFTDLHAWTEIYLPGAGWIGLDPTSGLLAGEGHIPLCSTAHYSNAAPISGGIYCQDELEVDFDFDMKVERIKETPRTSLPYTKEQSIEIREAGRILDKRIKENDMRLTMGGEPTFVSSLNMEADEWNVDALGPTKERYADELLHKYYKKFAPGGFLHHGQGKWYPGEPLPRWAYSAYWRKDGEKIWNNPELFARADVNYGHTEKESKAFTELLAKNLGVKPDFIRAGYEDIYYYMWKERRLPMNVTPTDNRLADKLERDAIAKVFEEGLGKEIGHMLPIARSVYPDAWKSGPWFLGTEEMYLHPGNHPMGYRLPIDGLPWAKASDKPIDLPAEPSAQKKPFRSESDRKKALEGIREWYEEQQKKAEKAPQTHQSAADQVRTALCVEPRDGRLNVFLPPLSQSADYLELVEAIEETSSQLGTPIRIEGYKPPSDPRINSFSVTPDPGVIEVNIHPSKTWDEIVDKADILYEEARQVGLGTEKFMQDGRHHGTGGGNHIVVGGESPLESPFLRKPDLIKSLVTYFNNHPSLSYFFSGQFIGPTSQAPRIDEARTETLYELETAFQSLPTDDTILNNCQWLVDRVLRNHFVDMTGNTHRSEICVDKLFSPGPSGRLGLLEFRGFEMPPHVDMALAQSLLMRGLITKFWEQPYDAKLVRWNTSIHDKWMLPHFLKEDLHDVLDHLQTSDINFSKEWFDPHYEFRFPMLGEYDKNLVQLELRQAIEPWHVLGEESSSSGTARYVDSSVDRVQVRVSNLTDSRHVVTCNGVEVPLHPTGRQGEYIAGIRYRAWSPFSALHPTKPINSPLTFDIIDTWNDKSLGGCQYHVVHPGGRAYEDFPLNGFVATSRRRSRFFKMNKSMGKQFPIQSKPSLDYPMTLDMQRYS